MNGIMNVGYLWRIAVSCKTGCEPVADRIPAELPDEGRRRGVHFPANRAFGNRLPVRTRYRMAIHPDVLLRDVAAAVAAAAVVGGGWVPAVVVPLRRRWRWIPDPDPFQPVSASGRPVSCTHLIYIKLH